MTNFLMDATELQIFDESGKLITEIKYNIRTQLLINGDKSKFIIENAILDLDLIKSLGETKDISQLSDFESKLEGNKTTIKFKKFGKYDNKYKIISKGIIYDVESETKSHSFNIILHSVWLDSPVEIDAQAGQNFSPSYVFKIEEDENMNVVDLELVEAK